MFKDESVEITQSIQNIKDIAKVFTDFTKTFSLPATKINNKRFKHYYNFNITSDFSFDARTKKTSTMELNNLPFKNGKLRLDGVDMKNNVPFSYRVTFFGSTVELKDFLGDDTLSSLNFGNSYTRTYAPANVRTALQLDPKTNNVIVPLISHSKRFVFDSSASRVNTAYRNLHYNASVVDGVVWNDLKYAIRVDTIVRAIEATHPISFTDDFFANANTRYYDLFMWLHRKKGDVQNPAGVNQSIVNGFTSESDLDQTKTAMLSQTILSVQGENDKYIGHTLILRTSSSTPYSASIQRNGLQVYNTGTVTGNNTITEADFDLTQGTYTIFLSVDATITFSSIAWFIDYRESNSQLFQKSYSTGSYVYTNTFDFLITQQIPEIKVIDFLTGIFKFFNLTALIDKNTNKVIVKTLDSFYASGNNIDVTEFVDPTESKVNLALPYRKINFQHEDTDTFLAKIHEQLFGKAWGQNEYTNGEKLDGGIYDVTTPFSQMKYERLLDVNGLAPTNVQYGQFTDDNEDPYLGAPLLFYPIKQPAGSTAISFVRSPTLHESINSYNVASNSVSLNPATSIESMNFFAETNEYTGTDDFTETLFETYYKNYIISAFKSNKRLTKVKLRLPLRILLTFTLADRFIISGNSYKINSITTDLETGISKAELLNDL
jgi:hypothetical protein